MISGRTKLIAHLGVPTESFTAPMIYNPWFDAKGIDTVVVPMGCEQENFPTFLDLLFKLRNVTGALITMPHKATAAGLVDTPSNAVKICGACNAIKRGDDGRLIGDIFDGEGFVRGVRSKGRTIESASVFILGCGGVGSAIAASLAGAGATRLTLYDVAPRSAENLAARLRSHYPDLQIAVGESDPMGHEIVVNATPLGMRDTDPLPMDVERIDPAALVGEVVLGVEMTPFLEAARARGCATQVGTDMLFEQIPAYLAFFGYPLATAEELRRLATIDP